VIEAIIWFFIYAGGAFALAGVAMFTVLYWLFMWHSGTFGKVAIVAFAILITYAYFN